MRAVGIVCEYNPFHSGHRYQLERAAADSGCDITLAVMSEYVTQRGELALADPYLRAGAAVAGGADLVVGLPYPFSAAPGEYFARESVDILRRLGVSALHFGSECGDTEKLRHAAGILASPAFAEAMTQWQEKHPNRGVMEGREICYRTLAGEDIPDGSNDLLGIAYLTAVQANCPEMKVCTVRRLGQAYTDGTVGEKEIYPSALSLRNRLQKSSAEDREAFLSALPEETRPFWAQANGRYPVAETRIASALLAFYRTADPAVFAGLQDLSGGVAERLCEAARRATDIPTLLTFAATRRYTAARLRRAMWFGYFGITPADLAAPVPYVRLLAASRKGCAYLAGLRKNAGLPVLTKPSDIPAGIASQKMRSLQNRVEALYTLALPIPRDAGFYLREKPYIAEE